MPDFKHRPKALFVSSLGRIFGWSFLIGRAIAYCFISNDNKSSDLLPFQTFLGNAL
jgi:hypothetical protein